VKAQDELVQFLESLPALFYGEAVEDAQEYYKVCRSFRVNMVKEQPDYLDIFKDDRTEKRWRSFRHAMILIDTYSVLRTWPKLMHDGWNAVHAARDVQVIREQCDRVIQDLNEAVEKEGSNSESRAMSFETIFGLR
jgi:hypothetical protein